MNKTSILLSVLFVSATIMATIFFTKNRQLKKDMQHSELTVAFLNNKITELESKMSDLKDQNEELEDKLTKVKHFDDDDFSISSSGVAYTGDAFKTQIDGEFNGWEGSTVFQMMDGSIWKQAAYDYVYHYAYSPEVLIYKKDGRYYMKVEDVDGEVEVERIR